MRLPGIADGVAEVKVGVSVDAGLLGAQPVRRERGVRHQQRVQVVDGGRGTRDCGVQPLLCVLAACVPGDDYQRPSGEGVGVGGFAARTAAADVEQCVEDGQGGADGGGNPQTEGNSHRPEGEVGDDEGSSDEPRGADGGGNPQTEGEGGASAGGD